MDGYTSSLGVRARLLRRNGPFGHSKPGYFGGWDGMVATIPESGKYLIGSILKRPKKLLGGMAMDVANCECLICASKA